MVGLRRRRFAPRITEVSRTPKRYANGTAFHLAPAQLAGAIDAERRRIERDLHDATQQRLVSLAMSIGLLEAKLPHEPHAARQIARGIRHALAETLEELRNLIHGIYPSILIERGLAAALQELCHRAAVRTDLELILDARHPAHLETAAYFIVCEALTNAVRHGRARCVRVQVRSDRQFLRVAVVDDGIGGARIDRGSGLRGLAERVSALGGRFVVSSPPGQGTKVHAEIPRA